MTKREVAELACRILALYYLVVNLHSLLGLPVTLGMTIWQAIQFGELGKAGIAMLFTAVATGLVILLVWFLWTRSGWIAEKMVPADANYSRWPRLRVADLQVVAFSMIGLLTFIEGARGFSRAVGLYVGALYSENLYDPGITFLDWFATQDTLASLVSCVVGLWLILGSRGIVRLIRRMRRPELNEGPEDLREKQEMPATESVSE